MNYSVYQLAVFDFIENGKGSAIVDAKAGSGKTSTILAACKLLPSTASVLFLAFNTSIVGELKAKLPKSVACCTFNSCGWRAWLSFTGKKFMKIEEKKTWKIVWDYFSDEDQELYGAFVNKMVALAKSSGLTPEDSDEKWWSVQDHHGVVLSTEDGDYDRAMLLSKKTLSKSIEQATTICDFDDQIYMPWLRNVSFQKHDCIFIDESQDTNGVQKDLLARMLNPNGRLIAVGDPNQCQPAGTQVSMTGGEVKNIEDLVIGDQVVSYDRHSASFVGRITQGRKILDTASRLYSGPLYTISCGGKETKATDNHRWLVRWTDRHTKVWVTYMMRLGNAFRVGWCQLFNKNGDLHLAQRSRIEKADCAWILSVHDHPSKASIEESLIATNYGLPTIPFQPVWNANHITEESIAYFFNSLTDDHHERVNKCLSDHGRLVEFPLYVRKAHPGRQTLFYTESCNLLDLMSISIFNGEKKADWNPISISTESVENLPVYSVKVETHEVYVANGILTHNCIYGFRGADADSFDKIKTQFNATVLPLSISYRCAKSVIVEAQKYVSGIEAFEHAPEGSVEHLNGYVVGDFSSDDAVLCRNNAPLIGTAYQMIARGKGVNFLGRDIGGGLKTLVSNMGAKDLTDLSVKLQAWLVRESDKLIAKRQEEKIELLEDRVNCIEIFMQYLPEARQTVSDLLSAIDALFERKGGITLSSVHKSKGREWKTVFILDFDKLMPSPYSKKDWQKVQENNLIYVAITRAQVRLCYINSNDWRDQPSMVIPEKKVEIVSDKVVKAPKIKNGKMTGFNPLK